ncbi:MAG: DUF4389 domain-containing protein [Candidatus Daviesbacteria bacterium]|nr:DUF4389 domain-containing protein [Candidatus Daviesbacteria bacterium]
MEKILEDLISQNPNRFYPDLKIDHIQNPNRFYAFPFLGGIFKIIILIPVIIELIILMMFWMLLTIINSFFVLFTGKYWNFAYTFSLGLMKFLTKISFYFEGLSNKYPGFNFNLTEFTLDIKKPENPSRFFAIPIIGGLVRIILIIPYFIWVEILGSASYVGTIASSFPVLFKGNYPESTYELNRDTVRVSLGHYVYMAGLSDTYPSFWISFNHKTIKIILLIIGVLITLGNQSNNLNKPAPKPLQVEPVACTMEVKECPDGSFVGRIPPTCQFAPCPIQ